jgi:hypothetical protein
MTRRLQTFRVSFSVTDFYVQDIRASSPQAAIAKARILYAEQFEAAFAFDIARGGHNDDWQAEQVS